MKIITWALILISFNLFAHEVSFTGPCDNRPIIRKSFSGNYPSVGDLTVAFLTQNNIEFLGDKRALHTVFGTPIGDAALEVVSDTEMRAYGWCYYVDDLGPDVYPDEYPLGAKAQKISWVFGFAHYKDGSWLTSCTPAFTVRPSFLCR